MLGISCELIHMKCQALFAWKSDKMYIYFTFILLTLLLLNMTCLIIAKIVDPDQLASEEANWSGEAKNPDLIWIYIVC